MARLNITVSFAWWLRPYLYGVICMTFLTGLEPDYTKVEKVIKRAVRIKLKGLP